MCSLAIPQSGDFEGLLSDIFTSVKSAYKVMLKEAKLVRRAKEPVTKSPRKRPPATTPEGREKQMVALAIDLAEKQLAQGTASSQVITHFLKIGSTKERLEKEMMEQQKELIKAKTEAIQSEKRVEELYLNALNAMRNYSSGFIEEAENA